jgi:hypothetical protein
VVSLIPAKDEKKQMMHEFVARVNKINVMLVEFPPKFHKSQMISEYDLKDLFEFTVPIPWRLEMVKQAFQPIDHDITEIVEFCERQEFADIINVAVRPHSNGSLDNSPPWQQNKGPKKSIGLNCQRCKRMHCKA